MIKNAALAASIKIICIASVNMDAFIPENKEYDKAMTANRTVTSSNDIPVAVLNTWLPARS